MEESKFKGLTRREFLKYLTVIAGMLGISETLVPQIIEALEKTVPKIPIIWMQGQNCTGCSVSLINSRKPTPAEIILDTLSIRFHPSIMASAGDNALKVIEDTMEKRNYIFVVEGAVPTKDNGFFCQVGEKNGKGIAFADWVKKVSKNALAVVAVGTCASFGGIPATKAVAKYTGTKPVSQIINKPVVNIPGCPFHPDWLVGTVANFLLFNQLPELDHYNRPKMFYGNLIHDNCPRHQYFEAGKFLEDWNDPEQKDFCLMKKGCKGPLTYSDCPIRQWNDATNWCIKAGSPCIGCTQPEFYEDFSPIYERLPDIKLPGLGSQVSADKIGKGLTIATGIGIVAHSVGQIINERLGKGGPPDKKVSEKEGEELKESEKKVSEEKIEMKQNEAEEKKELEKNEKENNN